VTSVDKNGRLAQTNCCNQAIALKTNLRHQLKPLADPVVSAVLQSYGGGGRHCEQKAKQTKLPPQSPSDTRPGSLQAGCAQQSQLGCLAPGLRIRHRSIHCLVLLGTSFGLQPHCGCSLPHAHGITRTGCQYDQPTAGRRASTGARSRRFRFAESGAGSGNQPSEGCQTTGFSVR
jgi:hypothetical protein